MYIEGQKGYALYNTRELAVIRTFDPGDKKVGKDDEYETYVIAGMETVAHHAVVLYEASNEFKRDKAYAMLRLAIKGKAEFFSFYDCDRLLEEN